jgi:hypothetical protein
MKASYLFGAILLCSVVGAMVPTRSVKTLLLGVIGVIAALGLLRALGWG